jgi:S1-C subfamily serine protease
MNEQTWQRPRWRLIGMSIVMALAGQWCAVAGVLEELQAEVEAAIEKASPAVVAIARVAAPDDSRPMADDQLLRPMPLLQSRAALARQAPYAVGSGVVIDRRGLVLTQYLNVRPGDKHTVSTTAGEVYDATIKGADPRSGLAVLQIEGAESLEAIAWGDTTKLKKGTFVVAIANPVSIAELGEPSASLGIISNIGVKAPSDATFGDLSASSQGVVSATLHQLGTLLQTDATLGWSSGGGALVDSQGQLVGLMTDAVTLPGHESAAHYAIPMNEAFRDIIGRLSRGEEVEYALLGVTLGDSVVDSQGESTARANVLGVFRGGPAAQAGVLPGDLIVAVNNRPIATAHELQLLVGVMTPGQEITLTLERSNRKLEVELVLSKYFVAGEKVVTASQPSWRGLRVDFATALPIEKLTQSSDSGLIDPDGCVLVSAVDASGPAWQSGVRPGMFVSHVGDVRVRTPREFYEAVKASDETLDLRFTEERRPAEFERDAQFR